MTVEIETSKAIGIQLLRHRSFTFQELSQRYAKVGGFEDIELRKQAVSNRQSSEEIFDPILPHYEYDYDRDKSVDKLASHAISDFLDQADSLYNALLLAGVAKECARMVLPMATSTTIYMTGSIRSWIHFLSIRDDQHAQKEIQLIAKEIKNLFIKKLPIISVALGYVTKEELDKKKNKLVDSLIEEINKADIHTIHPLTGEKIEVKASKKEI